MQPVTLHAFLRAILSSWFTAMSGPLSVPLTIAAVFVENPTARILLGATAFVCFWAAAYGVWARERNARNHTQAELTTARADNEQARAIERQTEELRRQREQRERELDPALRAFREQQFQTISAGGETDETNLSMLIWWVTVRSAWGRWQAAQHNFEEPTGEPHPTILQLAEHYFLDLLVKGQIVARAQRQDDESWEDLRPDWWKSKFFRVIRDPITLYKIAILWRPTGTDPRPIGYDYPRCHASQVKKIFPEFDEGTDAETKRLRLAQKQSC
jgi:hypothetical protein